MASGFKVKAIYEYASEEADDLSFPVGQVITITETIDEDWYEGEYTDVSGVKKAGIFPNNFVEKYEPEVPVRPSRPTRPKSVQSPPPAPVPAAQEPEPTPLEEDEEEDEQPPVPAASKPQPPPVQIPTETPRASEEVRSPPSASSQKAPAARSEPPAAPKPTPAEPAAAESKKPPPPVAPKSNAFKDRIAAFNQPAAAPVMPFQPGGNKSQPSNFIKKPFVAPPPSSTAYVANQRSEPVQKPYRREEDPEIKQRQEEDRAAAEAAGLSTEGREGQAEEAEDAPKPQSLKERIAMLQQQQAEQAQRRAGGGEKKEKKTPSRKQTEELEGANEGEDDGAERVRSPGVERQSLDVQRERPRVPSAQRRPTEPVPESAAQHEILSGGEEADQSAAGETTEDDVDTIGPDPNEEKPAPAPRAAAAPPVHSDVGEEGDTTEAAEDEEDSMDEEERRKFELRQRMAKMSGGMGMAGMFGPPGGMAMPGMGGPKKRTPSAKSNQKKASEDTTSPMSPSEQPQQAPMVPVPGMQRVQSPQSQMQPEVGKEEEPEETPLGRERSPDVVPDVEDVKPEPPPRASMTEERGAPPPVPKERPVSQSLSSSTGAPPVPGDRPVPRVPPGPPPAESRPVPPPPPPATAPLSPGPGSESDDEMSMHAKRSSAETSGMETPLPIRTEAPPVPGSRQVPPIPPQSPQNKRESYFGSEASISQTTLNDKRSSRVPPIPTSPPAVSSPRPPPPPPPAQAAPSRQSTNLSSAAPAEDERVESEYEADYDTDIASSAKHKDALKAHAREPSLDDSTAAEETPVSSPAAAAPPPLPTQRAVPPPPPQAASTRQSMDAPRAPPPMPPPRDMAAPQEEEYDPYRYQETSRAPPPVPGAVPVVVPPVPPRDPEPTHDQSSDDMYSASPPRKSMDRPPPPPPTQSEQHDRVPPMPPAQQAPPPARAPPRQSLDVQRTPTTGRRSMDANRPSGEHGQIAQDINLSEDTPWWTAPNALPPVFQSRNGVDILSECEESTTSRRGGRTTISKDIYILFIDYSQTVITARYDSREPSDVSLEQRHEPPPPKLRQDQLETYWQQFGAKIGETAASLGNSKKDSSLGDGTPYSFVSELIKANPQALHPVGTRAFGALVYANLANASVMQFDEIRPGDIVTLRNAKFEGKHSGPMHQKYKQDLGAGHVAVVAEWDGTRKKVRAWEQGREKRGVRMESFRLGDLKSGEVRVWRVVSRGWVGWEE